MARDSPETGGECSVRLLHCEDRAEPRCSLENALISFRSFGQRVGLDYRFNFSLGYVIQGFIKVFRAILLAADDFDALEEQLDQRDRKRFLVGAARCGKALSVADNFIRAQLANHLVLIRGV